MSGFRAEATQFFADLEDDNSREFWRANAEVFEREVKQPMTALLESLPERYQPFRLFRMNRDLRFTRDKSPYKTQQGAISEAEGSGYYLHLDGTGLLVAAGAYQMEPDQLERYRAAVDDARKGRALERILADLEQQEIATEMGMPALKTAPRGYAKDHPRVGLLRRKGLVGSRTLTGTALRDGDGVRDFVVETFTACQPLVGWLSKHVGAPVRRNERPR
ncbi:MAG TPA: DUF2461 domain-containing protein [Propionibacteriaceae bacterium]|jgi:uncharacterized protein (TIGR02453 family)|nr:DUF2461 domain-containing protein [Propionibacteriaceae bacterium]